MSTMWSEGLPPEFTDPYYEEIVAWADGLKDKAQALIDAIPDGPAAPATPSVIARSVDRANYAQMLYPGVYTPITLYLAVPPTTFSLSLEWSAYINITGAGAGFLGIGIADITNGTDPGASECGLAGRGGQHGGGVFSSIGGSFTGTKELDPSTTWRFYQMIGACYPDAAGNGLAAEMAASTAPGGMENNRNPYMKVSA